MLWGGGGGSGCAGWWIQKANDKDSNYQRHAQTYFPYHVQSNSNGLEHQQFNQPVTKNKRYIKQLLSHKQTSVRERS